MIKRLILFCLFAANVSAGEVKTITAYCGCEKCCGKWSAVHKTADGHTPTQDVTIAASRAIPFGTKIKILGKTYIVQDRLAARFDNRIDIYFDSHKEALQFGKKQVEVEFVK